MSKTITIDPVTRLEGHLKIEVEVDNGKVTEARSCGEMFRGFEKILQGRNPLDAQQITQRICGVCPAAHAQASTLNLDNAFGVNPPNNGRLIRNLVLAANYIQSHILHFYHLAALDYVDITAILNYTGGDPGLNAVKAWAKAEVDSGKSSPVAPFLPRYKGDYITDVDLNVSATDHYLTALVMRRKAQEMLAIFGGKMPHEIAILPGGATEKVTVKMILEYASRLREIQPFIENAYIPDVLAIAKAYSQYFSIGRGNGNLMSYGVFEEGGTGTRTFIPSGVYIDGKIGDFSPSKITEHVKHSKYSSASGKHPSEGETITDLSKKDAYSWLKSPRYDDKVVEVGPLARMGISHLLGSRDKTSRLVTDTLQSAGVTFDDMFSVMGRHAARALECKLLADRAAEWITQLKPGEPTHTKFEIPENSTGMGLTEAPRGSLGHWITIKNKKIDHYQVVVGTTWNCSPRDDHGQPGPLEQALVGTPIADPENPIEAARVVRSFDPCLACAIHVVTPDKELVSSLALA